MSTDFNDARKPGDPPEQNLAALTEELLRHGRVQHRFKIHLTRFFPDDLDWAAGILLIKIAHCGPTRQGELADRALLDPSTVSRYVSQLVRNELVERRPDPEDGRAVRLAATEAGLALTDRTTRLRDALLHQVLSHWDATDLSTLTALLRRFNDDLESFSENPVNDDAIPAPPDAPSRPRSPE